MMVIIMGNDRSDRLVEEWLTDEVLDVAEVILTDIEEDLNETALEQVAWEGISLGVDVDGAEQSIDPHEIRSDGISAESVKGSNISFNIDDLVPVLVSSAGAIGASFAPTGGSQLVAPVLALGVIHSVKMAATEELDVVDAVVFVAMHRGADGAVVAKTDLRLEVDSFVEEIDLPVTVGDSQLQQSIDSLVRIDAVEVLDVGDEPRYRPIEEYSVTFDDDS